MKKLYMLTIAGILALICIFYINCGDLPNSSQEGVMQEPVSLEASGFYINGNPVIELANGKQLNGFEAITEEFSKVFQENPDALIGLDISGIAAPDLSQPSEGITPNGIIGLPYDYYVLAYFDYHFLPACINRTVNHFNFKITKKGVSGSIANLHLAGWNEGTRHCLGIWVTTIKNPKGWCIKLCNPTFGDIVTAIATALIYAGITTTVAYIIAYILAPLVCAALAF